MTDISPAAASPMTVAATPDDNSKLDRAIARLTATKGALADSLPLKFQYRWRGIPVTVAVEGSDSAVTVSQLLDLGPIPFSAEDQCRRRHLSSLIARSGTLPAGRFTRTRGHHLGLALTGDISTELTVLNMTTAITRDLVKASPYLKLLDYD